MSLDYPPEGKKRSLSARGPFDSLIFYQDLTLDLGDFRFICEVCGGWYVIFFCPFNLFVYQQPDPWASLCECLAAGPRRDIVGSSWFYKLVIASMISKITPYEPVRHGPVHAAFSSFLVNRVEHQKRTQTATKWWPFGFVFGAQLGLWHTQALINFQHNNCYLANLYDSIRKFHASIPN